MILMFTSFENKEIGINPDHVVSVEGDDVPLRTIIHTADGKQRGVIGSVNRIIQQLDMPSKDEHYQ